jgi:hypothetical protein
MNDPLLYRLSVSLSSSYPPPLPGFTVPHRYTHRGTHARAHTQKHARAHTHTHTMVRACTHAHTRARARASYRFPGSTARQSSFIDFHMTITPLTLLRGDFSLWFSETSSNLLSNGMCRPSMNCGFNAPGYDRKLPLFHRAKMGVGVFGTPLLFMYIT